MEILSAAKRQLLGVTPVTGYVQHRVWKYRLEEKLDGTGRLAVVVRRGAGWATPDPIKTAEFPTLWVDCYADPTRDADGEIAQLDGEDKAYALYRVVDPVFHARRGEVWGAFGSNPGLMVASSARRSDPVLYSHSANPLPPGTAPTQDQWGDVVWVRVGYALEVVHGVLT